MRWIIRFYSFFLLAYTGWRTYDFMRAQLPSDATGQILALMFLLTTEAGLILWHEISLKHTTTEVQHYTAIVMTWLDFVASLGAGVADMILRATFVDGFIIPPILSALLIYGLPIATAMNVGAVLVYLSNDADTLIETQKRRLRFEIYKQTMADVRDSQGAIAASMKKAISAEICDDVTQNTIRRHITNTVKQSAAMQATATARDVTKPTQQPIYIPPIKPVSKSEGQPSDIPLPSNGNGKH
jgi:hypothetical protein